jgi:hypothetical protein
MKPDHSPWWGAETAGQEKSLLGLAEPRVPQLASGRAPEKPEKGGVFVEMRVEGRVTTGLGAELGLGQAAAGVKS